MCAKKGVVYAIERDSVDRDSEVRLYKWREKMAKLRKGWWVIEIVSVWGAVLSTIMRKYVDFVIYGVVSGC